ncbi:hypothetical protein [Ideonella sp. BN130291]|uniref:hypothetical protein n=1 Tax=Ideonella sp. BN130291 TaxID=3112940 RepID=UPI002E2668F6|nr:hypothetical protein [Ideonella sp. BN130291]
MQERADFPRLNRALDDAVAALPACECARQPAPLRRQCREVMLMLLQARERVRRLTDMFGPR